MFEKISHLEEKFENYCILLKVRKIKKTVENNLWPFVAVGVHLSLGHEVTKTRRVASDAN